MAIEDEVNILSSVENTLYGCLLNRTVHFMAVLSEQGVNWG
jgi:hypothetical protein